MKMEKEMIKEKEKETRRRELKREGKVAARRRRAAVWFVTE